MGNQTSLVDVDLSCNGLYLGPYMGFPTDVCMAEYENGTSISYQFVCDDGESGYEMYTGSDCNSDNLFHTMSLEDAGIGNATAVCDASACDYAIIRSYGEGWNMSTTASPWGTSTSTTSDDMVTDLPWNTDLDTGDICDEQASEHFDSWRDIALLKLDCVHSGMELLPGIGMYIHWTCSGDALNMETHFGSGECNDASMVGSDVIAGDGYCPQTTCISVEEDAVAPMNHLVAIGLTLVSLAIGGV